MREFRVRHPQYRAAGVSIAGVSRESPDSNAQWVARLGLPFPLLSDPESEAGRALHVTRRVPLGGWNIVFFRRTTFLADSRGVIVNVWEQVKVRGHAAQVLDAATALPRVPV